MRPEGRVCSRHFAGVVPGAWRGRIDDQGRHVIARPLPFPPTRIIFHHPGWRNSTLAMIVGLNEAHPSVRGHYCLAGDLCTACCG